MSDHPPRHELRDPARYATLPRRPRDRGVSLDRWAAIRTVLAFTDPPSVADPATDIEDLPPVPALVGRLGHRIAGTSLRYYGLWVSVIHSLAEREVKDLDVRAEAALVTMLAELTWCSESPPHAVIDGANRMAAEIGVGWAKGFINAVGRQYVIKRPKIEPTPEMPVRRWVNAEAVPDNFPSVLAEVAFDAGFPEPLIVQIAKAHGPEAATRIAQRAARPAKIDVTCFRETPAVIGRFKSEGCLLDPNPTPHSFRYATGAFPPVTRAFNEFGAFVQASAQCASALMIPD
jgi:hypothetical protein